MLKIGEFAQLSQVTVKTLHHYGEYLAQGCTACQGVDLNGGHGKRLNGDLVVGLNLTPVGELGG
jgi:hypothetical protein